MDCDRARTHDPLDHSGLWAPWGLCVEMCIAALYLCTRTACLSIFEICPKLEVNMVKQDWQILNMFEHFQY